MYFEASQMVPVCWWVSEPPLREKEWIGCNSSHMDDSGDLKLFNLRPNQVESGCDSKKLWKSRPRCRAGTMIFPFTARVNVYMTSADSAPAFRVSEHMDCHTRNINYVWAAQVSRRLWVAKLSTQPGPQLTADLITVTPASSGTQLPCGCETLQLCPYV